MYNLKKTDKKAKKRRTFCRMFASLTPNDGTRSWEFFFFFTIYCV